MLLSLSRQEKLCSGLVTLVTDTLCLSMFLLLVTPGVL